MDPILNWLGLPVAASAHAGEVDRIMALVHWLMLVLFVGWSIFFIYVLFRFRSGAHPKADYRGVRAGWSNWVEGGVLVAEIALLAFFSIPFWTRNVDAAPPSENQATVVRVVAEQFAWNAQYPGKDGVFGKTDSKFVTSTNPLGIDPSDPNGKDDIATLNQLHLEVNRPVVIDLSSKDVIHSFFLPVMRVKQDAIPGQQVAIHFTPIRTTNNDKWEIACAQLCGLGHYRMRGQFTVHSKDEFTKWLASNAPENPATPAANPVPSAAPATPAEAQPGGGPAHS